MFSYIGAHLYELNTNPANKFAHVFCLTYARWCACSTDYMNKLEYVCLCLRLTRKNTNKTQIDMTIINTRMFGIMFDVNLLFASFKISTFMNKPLFIHTSEKL